MAFTPKKEQLLNKIIFLREQKQNFTKQQQGSIDAFKVNDNFFEWKIYKEANGRSPLVKASYEIKKIMKNIIYIESQSKLQSKNKAANALSYSKHPHSWLENAETKMIELYDGKDKNVEREFKNLFKNNERSIQANNISFELIFNFNNLTKKKQEKIKEIVKLFIHNHEKIDNPELKSLVAHYIFNKIKTPDQDYSSKINESYEYMEAIRREISTMGSFISYLNVETNHKPNDIKIVVLNEKECYFANNKRPKVEDIKVTNDIGLIYKLMEERICSNVGLEPIIDEQNANLEDIAGKISWRFIDSPG